MGLSGMGTLLRPANVKSDVYFVSYLDISIKYIFIKIIIN